MTQKEKDALRAEILKTLGADQLTNTPAPLPPGIQPGTLTPEAAEQVSDTWIKSLLARDALTPEERRGLGQAIQRAMERLDRGEE
jgi:hypothetical protein